MRTYQAKPAEVKRVWHLVDLRGQVLGKAAVQIAHKLMGKHKVTFTPHVDSGDFVVVINAKDVVLTGNKAEKKTYYTHSLIPKGFKEIPFGRQMEKDARKVVRHAVAGMIPKNKQQDPRLARLKVFVDDKHPYAAQIGHKSEEK